MKKTLTLSAGHFLSFALFAQKKTGAIAVKTATSNTSSAVPAAIQGAWMYGNFSLTGYWSTSPRTYLGNAFTFAIAFLFKSDGTYEQYFTSSVNNYGINTYHQSLTRGRFKVDEATKTISTTPIASHYKRTGFDKTEEDRDIRPEEISKTDTYAYALSTEPNGTQAISLTIAGTKNTLKFLKKVL